ncbi:MAG: polyhydroxyalkanoate synthesis repressor PhaR [Kiloniellales bacterium]
MHYKKALACGRMSAEFGFGMPEWLAFPAIDPSWKVMVQPQATEQGPAVIKKYANRRLYNTKTARFVTLETLRRMVADGEEFVVRDARTGRDLTASILAQIIAEQGSKGEDLLPLDLLRQVITVYHKGMGGYLAAHLERSMETFAQNWERMHQMGELGRRNLELFQQSMGMFMPTSPVRREDGSTPAPEDDDATKADFAEQVRDLRAQLKGMQRRLDELSRRRGKAS